MNAGSRSTALARVVLVAGAVVVVAGIAGSAACGPSVSCENLCAHTLACEVTFAPKDDVDGSKITSGERTDVDDCKLGCQENPAVTVESAQCVDAATATSTDPATCQQPVLDCFGAKVAQSTRPSG